MLHDPYIDCGPSTPIWRPLVPPIPTEKAPSLTGEKPSIRVIRWAELQQKIGGRSLSTLTRSEEAGEFPKRICQGNLVGRFEHEIDAYLLSLPRGTRRG